MTRFLPVLALLGVACSAAPEAKIGAKSPDAVAPSGKVETYTLAKGTVRVEADVSAGSAYTLRFPSSTGQLSFSPDVPEASSVQVAIDTTTAEASIDLVADIARDQFLHTGTYPEAKFVSSALRKNADGTFTMYGTLTLHGTSKSLATPAKIVVEKCKLSWQIEFAIDRRGFGAISDGSLDPLVSDTVVVRILADVPRGGTTCTAKSPTSARG